MSRPKRLRFGGVGPSAALALLLALFMAACRDEAARTPPTSEAPATTVLEPAVGDPARGREIYVRGVSPSGSQIEAALEGDVVMDAKTMPCIGCHGEDGLGRPEGGMRPSNITWEVLSKPYGGHGQDGREHVAYTRSSLRKAITMGVDPSGNGLQRTMPRYQLSSADLDDLVAYIQVLGQHWAVGIDETSIRVLTIAVVDAAIGDPAADMVEAVLGAYLSEINKHGGMFGRSLDLGVLRIPSGATLEVQMQQLEAAFADDPPFAVLAPRFGDAEGPFMDWLGEAGVPVIGPTSSYPDPGTPPRPSIFYIDGGIPAQALALAELAARGREGEPAGTAVVVFPDREPERGLAQDLLTTWEPTTLTGQALAVPLEGEGASPAVITDKLTALGPEVVLFLGPSGALAPILSLAAESGAAPQQVLVPGSLGFGDPFGLPGAYDGRVFLAYPWLPTDVTPASLQDYQALVKAHDLPEAARPLQLATLTTGVVFLEALSRAGRGVTRSSLVSALERFNEFPTGLTPELTYGPNQRVGLHDVRIVAVDLERRRLEPVPEDAPVLPRASQR